MPVKTQRMLPYNDGERKPTIIDVAREARVGKMTVSRVINDYHAVRPKTRAKVLAAIAEVGYRANEAARILKGMREKTPSATSIRWRR